jgi:hypothetical protein
MGWHTIMIDGLPFWVPPTWLDPHQTPRRNTRHDMPNLKPSDLPDIDETD